MPAEKIKKELMAFIANTNDEDLLSLMMEDFVFYGQVKNADITDKLSDDQLKELAALSEEDASANTHTLDDFKKATQQWRTK